MTIKLKFWLLQLVFLPLVLWTLAWANSQPDGSAFIPPPLGAAFMILAYWGLPPKIPSLICQHLFICSRFWAQSNRLLRVFLFYLIDIACAAIAAALLYRVWIAGLFTLAIYPFEVIIFPYAIVVGFVLSFTSASEPADAVDHVALASTYRTNNPRLPALVNGVIALSALLLSLAAAAGSTESSIDLAGMTLAFLLPCWLLAKIYFAPTLSALRRVPHLALWVLLGNVLLGWTVLAWLGTLLWLRLYSLPADAPRLLPGWKAALGWLLVTVALLFAGISLTRLDDSTGGAVFMLALSALVFTSGWKLLRKPVNASAGEIAPA